MRNYIDIVTGTVKRTLTEADEPKTKTKTAVKTDADTDLKLDLGLSKGELAPAGDTAPTTDAPGAGPVAPPGKKAGRARTRASVKPIDDPRAGRWLSDLSMRDLGLDDEIDDDEAARRAGASTDGAVPEPRTPENLPAVISTAVARSEDVPFEPQWHMVRHLPGYMQRAIRAMGRQIFGPFTETPLEDIQVLSTLSNDDTEVKMMAAWIRKNGVRDDQAEMDFAATMPGYAAQTQIWSTQGYQFMIVKDFAGYYIYGWPGGRGVHVGAGAAPRRLR